MCCQGFGLLLTTTKTREYCELYSLSSYCCIAHPGPAKHLFNLFILWLHQHGKLQILNGVLMSTEHLLQRNKA